MSKLYNLTNPQKSIWFTESFYPGTSLGNISGTILIDEKVDFDLLEKALNIYVQKNDSIRLHIVVSEIGEVKQYVSDFKAFKIPVTCVKNDEELIILNTQIAQTPFDLIDSDLFKFNLIKFPNQTGGLQVTFHHLISDAWTMSLFIDETMSIYSKLLNKEEINYSLNSSYIDYIETETNYINSSKFEKDKQYWNDIYNYEHEIASMKTYKNNETNTKAIRKIFTLENTVYKNILKFCTENKISVFTFLMSVYSIYLAKINNLENVTIGTPILNRSNFKEKHTSGMYISTVPFNVKIDANIDFITYVSNVSIKQMNMFRHQKYPYQLLLEDIKQKNSNISKLYDIALSYQNARDIHSVNNINYHTKWLFNGHISDSLEIHFYDMDDSGNLDIYYDYQICKFNDFEIKQIHDRILNIIKQVLENRNIKIYDVKIITPIENDKLINFNNTKTTYPLNKNIIDLFYEQVSTCSNSPAVNFEGISLSYEQLNQKSNMLAFYLLKQNVKPQDVIAMFMDKSIEAIISILAILKVGAIYLPIDTMYPQDRITYMLKDSNAKLILSTSELLESINSSLPVINTSLSNAKIYNTASINNITSAVSIDDLAYIMYTSGSTGTPKGVLITHRGIIRLVKNTNYIKFDKGDKILQTGSIVFDACTFEIWGALLNGLELFLLKKSDLLNPIFFEKYIIENKITTLFLTTALFNNFCEANSSMFRNLKYLLTGGEAVSKKHMKIAKENNPNLNLVHVYGPTENTTFSTYYYVKDDFEKIPIGFPISNTTCYVVSKLGGLQPINTPGELWVGGDGISTGYLHRDDLNKEKFIQNPFENGNVYKTGDLVTQNDYGSIDFIGRIDNQVKIRGFRIELSEIDSSILTYPGIKESITIMLSKDNNKYLCSYITCNKKIDIADLQAFLKINLPYYMLPSFFKIVDELPLNINGKIDKKRLPEIDIKHIQKNIKEPNSRLQEEILAYLNEITKREIISIDEDFIDDLHLDSLNTMELATKLYKYNVNIQDITNFSTVEKLADKISNEITNDCYNNHFKDVQIINKPFTFDLSCVLLTGTTGFLGPHILIELVNNTKVKKIYCLIREKNGMKPIQRLRKIIDLYFDENLKDKAYDKILVINGNFIYDNLQLSKDNYKNLCNKITTIIHCGAKVKHFGKYDDFYKANVIATKNIIKFCQDSKASLGYISTLSVGGLSKINSKNILDENKININQEFKDQVYMYTKYEAECEILKSIVNNDLNAKIFRLGNIMPRLKDGIFQANYKDNAFVCKINTLIKTNSITDELLKTDIDLSPVDLCSKSIILLLNSNDKQNIYHIYNNNKITLNEFFKLANIKLNLTSKDELVNNIMKINNVYDTHLLNELKYSDLIETLVTNDITISILNSLDFKWNVLDSNYIKNIIYLGKEW